MDLDTYDWPQESYIRPQCRDMLCVNYCQRRKTNYYTCPPGPVCDGTLHARRMAPTRRYNIAIVKVTPAPPNITVLYLPGVGTPLHSSP